MGKQKHGPFIEVTTVPDTAPHPVVVILPDGDTLTLHQGTAFETDIDGTTLHVLDAQGTTLGTFAQWVGVYR